MLDLLRQPPLIPTTQHKTASLYHAYYADVPDDVATVAMRASAWSIVPVFWDGLLLDTTFTYTLGGSQSYTLANGAHWMTLSISTTHLGKFHTLALTDGNVTVQADNGQVRYVAQDRSFVFLVDATASYSTIAAGMHAFVVSRGLYMDSQLKIRIEGGTTWPLDSTEFFAEDTAQAEMSEAVTAVTAGSLTGSQAYWLLQYLLQNTTGDLVYEAVDVRSYVPLLNLPMDAVNIIPWVGVTSGPRATLPDPSSRPS